MYSLIVCLSLYLPILLIPVLQLGSEFNTAAGSSGNGAFRPADDYRFSMQMESRIATSNNNNTAVNGRGLVSSRISRVRVDYCGSILSLHPQLTIKMTIIG